MKTIYTLSALLLALATPFALALPAGRTAPQAQRVAIGKTEPDHVGQVPGLYEVRDLMLEFGRDYPSTKLGVIEAWHAPEATKAAPSKPDALAEDLAQVTSQLELGGRNLVDVLKRHLQPPFAASTERLECTTGTLVAHLMPEQHAWVEAFLRRLRDFDGFIEVETRIIEAAPAVFESLGLEDKSILARPADLKALDERIRRATGQCNLLFAPRLRTRLAGRSSVTTTSYFKFVQDWSIEKVEPGPREIAVPKIAVIREGVALDVRALPVDDDHFAIELGLQSARVNRPVRTVSIKVGSESKSFDITLAEAESVQFDGTVLLASGSSAILRGMSVDQSKSIAVIVTARKVPRERR